LDEELQCARRDGLPLNRRLAEVEQAASDELRESVVNQMKKDMDTGVYKHFDLGTLNADMPSIIRFKTISARFEHMSGLKAMPGELELIETTKHLGRPIKS